MNNLRSELKSAWVETLDVIANKGGEVVGAKQIADSRGVSKQAVSKLLPKLEDEGYIKVDESSEPYIISLTTNSIGVVDSTPYGRGSVDTSSSSEGKKMDRRLHGLTVNLRVKGGEVLPSKWMGKLGEIEDTDFVKRDNNDVIAVKDIWYLRCHKDSITVQLREGCSVKGDSSSETVDQFQEKLSELKSELERRTGVGLDIQHVDVNRMEIGFERHHLAVLADRVPGLSLSDFSVRDEDIGREVISMDKSPGFPELETMSPERAEEIGQSIDRELWQLCNPERLKKRHGFENEMAVQDIDPQQAVHTIRQAKGTQEQIQQTEAQVKQVNEEIESMKQKQKQLLELKAEERKKTEQLESLVQSNQELLEKLVHKVHEESGQSFDNPVQKKWVEVDEDPDYHSPYFREDNGGMYAFRSDGSGCERIMSGEAVERLS